MDFAKNTERTHWNSVKHGANEDHKRCQKQWPVQHNCERDFRHQQDRASVSMSRVHFQGWNTRDVCWLFHDCINRKGSSLWACELQEVVWKCMKENVWKNVLRLACMSIAMVISWTSRSRIQWSTSRKCAMPLERYGAFITSSKRVRSSIHCKKCGVAFTQNIE